MKYPEDREAQIFCALAIAASEDPADKTYAGRLKAGAILEKLFAEEPSHPGLAHYIIHTYDVPALAGRGLVAARRYSEIAPDVPHALHMPSHTFTRTGYWQESIDSNVAAAASLLVWSSFRGCAQYHNCSTIYIYLSWDAASWHISQDLATHVKQRNDEAEAEGYPVVKTAPLPAGAQFLNVLESVFSGMARGNSTQ